MVIYLIVNRLVSIKLCCEQNGTEGQAKSGPILSLPLMTIADPIHPLRDMPVCQVITRFMKLGRSILAQK